MSYSSETLRIAGISDTHFSASDTHPRISKEEYIEHVKDMSRSADLIVHCGDFTDEGDTESALLVADIFRHSSIPVVGVMGNHDYRNGNGEYVKKTLTEDGGVLLLSGDLFTYRKKTTPVGIIGATGFTSARKALHMASMQLTEEEYHDFAQGELDAFKSNISYLPSDSNVGIFHFEPYRRKRNSRGVANGKLRSSNYGSIITNYKDQFSIIFHGHDHRGESEPINTKNGFDQVNVAAPVTIAMTRGIPYRIAEIPIV